MLFQRVKLRFSISYINVSLRFSKESMKSIHDFSKSSYSNRKDATNKTFVWKRFPNKHSNKHLTPSPITPLSPSSGTKATGVSLPPGCSAAGEYQASITKEKAPWGKRNPFKITNKTKRRLVNSLLHVSELFKLHYFLFIFIHKSEKYLNIIFRRVFDSL